MRIQKAQVTIASAAWDAITGSTPLDIKIALASVASLKFNACGVAVPTSSMIVSASVGGGVLDTPAGLLLIAITSIVFAPLFWEAKTFLRIIHLRWNTKGHSI